MQERINKENVMILRRYFHSFISLGVVEKKEEGRLRKQLTALLEIVKNSKKFAFPPSLFLSFLLSFFLSFFLLSRQHFPPILILNLTHKITKNREKEVHILSLSADASRAMSGGRLTSCKSAKDRYGYITLFFDKFRQWNFIRMSRSVHVNTLNIFSFPLEHQCLSLGNKLVFLSPTILSPLTSSKNPWRL